MKDIVKRIFIGICIGLALFFLKGLILDVSALEVDMKPDSFNLGNSNFTSTSVVGGQFTYTYNGTTTYSMWQSNPQLPTFSGTDWLYLPYSTISSNSFCVETSNTGSFNSVFLNPYPTGSANPFTSQNKVQIQPLDQSSNPRDCTITYQDNAKIEFNCTNVDFTKNYRVILTPVRSAPIFIWQKFNINCIAPDSSNSDIINNNNNNTTNIINNNITNTQNIIDAGTQNAQDIIDKIEETNKVCEVTNITFDSNRYNSNTLDVAGYLNTSGSIVSNTNWKVSEYINIYKDQSYTLSGFNTWDNPFYCTYNNNKELISCTRYTVGNMTSIISLNQNGFVRISYSKETAFHLTLNGELCKNGNQAINDKLDDISSDHVDDGVADGFFNHLLNNEHNELADVVTAPLRFINSFTNQCSPVTIPVLNQDVILPCGDTLFWNRQDVQTFRTFWNLLFGGLIIYRLALKLFHVVNDAIDPTKDNINGLEV